MCCLVTHREKAKIARAIMIKPVGRKKIKTIARTEINADGDQIEQSSPNTDVTRIV
jgi:hypothetical protein